MRRIALLGMLLFSFGAQAQKLEFKETKHNFGQIKEKDGKVSYVFAFKNTGDKPLIIQNVNASCGCTTPDWSKQPVAPGKQGMVKAVFDPSNRNGQFNKSIRVSSNALNGSQTLYINGTIEKRPPSLKDYYRQEMGGLNFKSTYTAFTKITDQETKTQKIEFVNLSDKAIALEALSLPSYIEIKFNPERVKPKEKGTIDVIFHGKKANDYGYSMNYVRLKMNGVEDSKYRIMVSSNVKEDFSHLTAEDLAKAPKVEFENVKVQDMGSSGKRLTVDYDFGTIVSGEKVERLFKFKNTGQKDLIIRRTKASCGCTATAPSKKVVKPGETAEIKAVFDSKGRSGPQSKSITVTLNDPESPTVKLYLRGAVKKQQD